MAAVTCPTKQQMLRMYFDSLVAQAQAMSGRVAAGLESLNAVLGAYADPPDPSGCRAKAQAAIDLAESWQESFNQTVFAAEKAIRDHLDEMCEYLDWMGHADQIETQLQNHADYLASSDQDLGSMEIEWYKIKDQCPVPRPIADQPADNTVPGGGGGD